MPILNSSAENVNHKSEPARVMRTAAATTTCQEFHAANRLRAACTTMRGTLLTRKHIIITGADRAEVVDTRERWIPGEPLPKDRGPKALLALCRNAEAYEHHAEEMRRRDRRAA